MHQQSRASERALRRAPRVVHAGFPSPAQDYYSGPVDLNRHLMRDPTTTYVLRVSGDSMIGAGIFDGDEVLVDRGLDARDGSVVVAVLNGELTLKRLLQRGGVTALQPENPRFPTIPVAAHDDLEIWGVVTRCLHRV
ncbi:translesion error-prone DNA polymerase V autoproteolytic subunit [Agrococcus versicolor]|uniref:Translesion error-prone DNA polymerase V autoproteolytic subunit n=1 Tax=Agrococcus versicolor TaxID=501482 RepID=A0ABN3AUQ5_9MICO